ncbi:MAG: hypothetical protein IAG13_04670 [Deltaproteobacteria bacterium]|nr:hypothetical protein [Nannocystaceae bacterium]
MATSPAALLNLALPFAVKAATRVALRSPLFAAAALGCVFVYRMWQRQRARQTVTADEVTRQTAGA